MSMTEIYICSAITFVMGIAIGVIFGKRSSLGDEDDSVKDHLIEYCEFYLDSCSHEKIQIIADGKASADMLKNFKPELSRSKLALHYLQMTAKRYAQEF